MYNVYPEGGYFCEQQNGQNYCRYNIQAGNPKNGTTFIGSYWIEDIGNGWYVAKYELDGLEPSIDPKWVIVEEHLAISDVIMNFTAAPGKDDNADFFVPFEATEPFFVFAHFAMDCAEQ